WPRACPRSTVTNLAPGNTLCHISAPGAPLHSAASSSSPTRASDTVASSPVAGSSGSSMSDRRVMPNAEYTVTSGIRGIAALARRDGAGPVVEHPQVVLGAVGRDAVDDRRRVRRRLG